ncbi:adenosine deaminase [Mycetocola tolaasinivorans]|uniref:adenosine deaminase n=1 Tax=Mycetocola tolaasinivorans TaxID=76635 RepID=A0A3L7A7U0_9MICO|nr:adenosine deaminase [Mycetocola tolaasinivorans]RLP75948.1 adenosine deaminase [Mycetocola tolaasinivorans]
MSTSDNYTLPGGINLRALPKVSLHDHLDGGVRPQTILDLAAAAGVEPPVDTAEELAEWFIDQASAGNLPAYLETFDLTISVLQTADALARVAREFVHDLAEDGVIYAEIRWAPEQHLRGGLTLDRAVEAVEQGLERGVDDVRRGGREIEVGQLITAMRHADRALEIAELAVRHRERGVVGFDIAGAEDGFPPARHRLAFDYLAQNHFPVTVHAGEAAGLDSIRGALFDGRALRIGHGVRLAEDIEIRRTEGDNTYVTMGELAHWINDREIALELSPSSNLQTGAIDAWGDELEDHPFDLLYQLGFSVTVNVDNRTVTGTSLTRELALLADAFEYDLEDLEIFQLNAAAAAFMPTEDREYLTERIRAGFDAAADA